MNSHNNISTGPSKEAHQAESSVGLKFQFVSTITLLNLPCCFSIVHTPFYSKSLSFSVSIMGMRQPHFLACLIFSKSTRRLWVNTTFHKETTDCFAEQMKKACEPIAFVYISWFHVEPSIFFFFLFLFLYFIRNTIIDFEQWMDANWDFLISSQLKQSNWVIKLADNQFYRNGFE